MGHTACMVLPRFKENVKDSLCFGITDTKMINFFNHMKTKNNLNKYLFFSFQLFKRKKNVEGSLEVKVKCLKIVNLYRWNTNSF